MVYLIVVYDVASDNNRGPRTFLRTYLTHVQNSVFEGEVTKADAEIVRDELKSMVSSGESVIIFEMKGEKYVDRSVIGEDPRKDHKFI